MVESVSLNETRGQRTLYLALISGLLIAFGIPIVDSLLIGLIVFLLSLSGIMLFAISNEYGDYWTRGAIGFLGMTVMTACAHQLFLDSLGALTWIIVPSISFLVGFRRLRLISHKTTVGQQLRTNTDDVFLLIACILLVLAPIYLWTFFGALIALLISLLLKRSALIRANMLIGLCIISAFFLLVRLAVMLLVRDGWADFRWGIDESLALSKSVFKFGILDNIYAAGHPLSYQWLNFSVMGMVDTVNSGDLFQTSSKSIWVIGGFLVILTGRGIVLHSCREHQLRDPALVVLAILSSLPLTPVSTTLLNISAGGVSSAYLLAFLYCVLRFGRSNLVRHSFLIVVLALGSVAIRSVHLILVVPLVFYCAVNDLGRVRKLSPCIHILGLGVIMGYYFLLLPSSDGTGLNWSPFKFDFVTDIGYESLQHFPRLLLGLMIIAILLILPAVSLKFLSGESILLRFFLFGVLLIGASLTVLTSRTSYGELHFIQVPLIALMPFSAIAIGSSVQVGSTKRDTQSLAQLLIVLVLSLGFSTIFGRLLVMGHAEFAYFYFGHFLGLVFVVATTVGTLAKLQKPSRVIQTFRGSLAVLLVFQFAFIAVAGHYRILMRPIDANSLRPTELSAIGEWSRSNLPQDSVLVTNLFFGGLEDSQLPPDPCPKEAPKLDNNVVDAAINGGYYLPAAIIQRRFIALGPEYGFIAYPQYRRNAVVFSLEVACGIKLGTPPTGTPIPTHVLRYSTDGEPTNNSRQYGLLFHTTHLYVYKIEKTD